MRLRENSRSASAAATFLPRIRPATRLSFCGLTRSIRATAWASFSPRLRSCAFLLIAYAFLNLARSGRCRCTRSPLCLSVRRVAVEGARRRELAELVTDHFLGHLPRNVLVAVVDTEEKPDELRQDRRAAAPDPDHL